MKNLNPVSSINANPDSRFEPFFSDADIQWTNGRTDVYKSQLLATNTSAIYSFFLRKFGNK